MSAAWKQTTMTRSGRAFLVRKSALSRSAIRQAWRDGEAVGAGADRGEGDGAAAEIAGDFQRAPIATRQQFGLALASAVPDRTDGVDDVAGGQVETRRGLGVAGGAAAENSARGQQFRPGGAVDGAVHAAAAEQRGVGRVDDGIDVLTGEIALDQLDAVGKGMAHADFSCFRTDGKSSADYADSQIRTFIICEICSTMGQNLPAIRRNHRSHQGLAHQTRQ